MHRSSRPFGAEPLSTLDPLSRQICSGRIARRVRLRRGRWRKRTQLATSGSGRPHVSGLSGGRIWSRSMPDSALRSNNTRGEVAFPTTALVIFDGLCARPAPWTTSHYSLVEKGLAEPVCVISSTFRKPARDWQATHQDPCPGVVAASSCGHEETDWTCSCASDCMQLRIHFALRPSPPGHCHATPCRAVDRTAAPARLALTAGSKSCGPP